jgi:methylglyoxal synthase
MGNVMNIAVIAHDGKKADIVAFIMKRLDFFGTVNIIATGTNRNSY